MLRRARAAWPFDLLDVLALVGLLLITAGCWAFSPPVAMIVAGTLILGYAVLAAYPARPRSDA